MDLSGDLYGGLRLLGIVIRDAGVDGPAALNYLQKSLHCLFERSLRIRPVVIEDMEEMPLEQMYGLSALYHWSGQ